MIEGLLNRAWRQPLKFSNCVCLVQALVAVAAQGDITLVRKALNAGADPNFITSDGKFSPLSAAAAKNHGDVVRLLIERGASVGLTVSDGLSPMQIAVGLGSADAVRALVAGGADPNEFLITAVVSNDRSVILALIQGGGNVNIESSRGITALGLAAYIGNQEAIEVLVENGADKTKTGGVGVLPRDALCQCMFSSEIPEGCKTQKCQSPRRMISLLNP